MIQKDVGRQKPTEKITWTIDCKPILSVGETITSLTSVTTQPSNSTINFQSFTENTVILQLSNLVNEVTYKVEAVFTTNVGDTKEATAWIKVSDTW